MKVQRPGIGENIALDMVLLRRLMRVVDKSLKIAQPLVPLVDEFAGRLFAELDYVQVRLDGGREVVFGARHARADMFT